MTEYMYEVICEGNDFFNEKFETFEEAKAYAEEHLEDSPIVNEVEVIRNDFGECESIGETETVWRPEPLPEDEPEEAEVAGAEETEDEYFDRLARDGSDTDVYCDNVSDGDCGTVTEETHTTKAQPAVDREAAYEAALKIANKNNKPVIYGYMGSDKHQGNRYFALDNKVCDDLKSCTAEIMKQYHPSGSVLVAYPSGETNEACKCKDGKCVCKGKDCKDLKEDYSWIIDPSKAVDAAYDFIDNFGADTFINEISVELTSDDLIDLVKNLATDFEYEIDTNSADEAINNLGNLVDDIGETAIADAIIKYLSTDQLADLLAYTFRQYDYLSEYLEEGCKHAGKKLTESFRDVYYCPDCNKYFRDEDMIVRHGSDDFTPYGGAAEPGFSQSYTEYSCPECGSEDVENTSFDEEDFIADEVVTYFDNNDVTEADREKVRAIVEDKLYKVAENLDPDFDDEVFDKEFNSCLNEISESCEKQTEEIDYTKLREELEENEDEVECQDCGDLCQKCECTFNEEKHGYVCKNCSKEPTMFVETKESDSEADKIKWILADTEYGYYKLYKDSSLDKYHRFIRIEKPEYDKLKKAGVRVWRKEDEDDDDNIGLTLQEAFTNNQRAQFFDLCKKAGIKTINDLKKFVDDNKITEANLLDILKAKAE